MSYKFRGDARYTNGSRLPNLGTSSSSLDGVIEGDIIKCDGAAIYLEDDESLATINSYTSPASGEVTSLPYNSGDGLLIKIEDISKTQITAVIDASSGHTAIALKSNEYALIDGDSFLFLGDSPVILTV